jgi:hypothetical protein
MEEKVMEKLMKSYEAEISNPVRSLLFGNLMTAMLIQVSPLSPSSKQVLLCSSSSDSKDESEYGERSSYNGQGEIFHLALEAPPC